MILPLASLSMAASYGSELREAAITMNPQLEIKEGQAVQASLAFREKDPSNPKNWSKRRRWSLTNLLSCFTLISPISSSMVAPVLDVMEHDLSFSSSFERHLIFSIFVLFYGVGPNVHRVTKPTVW